MPLNLPGNRHLFTDEFPEIMKQRRMEIIEEVRVLLEEASTYTGVKALIAKRKELISLMTQSTYDGLIGRWENPETYNSHLGILKNLVDFAPEGRRQQIADEITRMEASPPGASQTSQEAPLDMNEAVDRLEIAFGQNEYIAARNS